MVKRRQAGIKNIFLDSSVLFSAVNSPTGGSAKLFTLKNTNLTTSTLVLTEVERNVREKLEIHHLERFFMLVAKLHIIKGLPDEKLMQKAKKVIVVKDAPILAEAKRSKAEILATLDRKHFFGKEVKKFFSPSKIKTPKDIFAK
ncbi:type II toxin-antitoxin system VapC family toxin [Candidatus Gottesmanbacteria bacterium]|nr:type II toxin-antitoxin system VapC family toxin [Candidatus Gottesmanbacteria bacterium]